MEFKRSSGILLHPTSLPNRFGIGDMGEDAYRFIDFLAGSGQGLWQILPLGPTGYGDSPYQCFSAFAGNTLLISPQKLLEDGLINADVIAGAPISNNSRVDFGNALKFKSRLFHIAHETFKHGSHQELRQAGDDFYHLNGWWLEDYAMFRALRNEYKGVAWNKWEPAIVRRERAALDAVRKRLGDEIEEEKFTQFLFYKQWLLLKDYAHSRQIKIIGDIPIFVAHDSADVWCNPHLFKLDDMGNPLVVAGVPPDYFSSTGQLWGNPIYDWQRMPEDGFRWWIARFQTTLAQVDIIRLDHFRGFAACWEVPAGEETAVNGEWVSAPGIELFTAVKNVIGELPFIAEDLGIITPDVVEMRDMLGLPGMRVLQFAFISDAANHDLPHNYVTNCVAYTGTHDNDTTQGWFTSAAGEGSTRSEEEIKRERKYCLKYLGLNDVNTPEIHWEFIRAVLASVAHTAVIPLQDLLGLGHEARMNLPASTSGNWSWRYRAEDLSEALNMRLKGLTELYGRAGHRFVP